MNILRFYFTFSFISFFIVSFGQKTSSIDTLKSSSTSGQSVTNKMSIQKIDIASLQRRIKERENKIKKTIIFTSPRLFIENILDKDTIISILKDSITEKSEIIKAKEIDSRVINFLGITDTTIFKSQYIILPLQGMPPLIQNHYKLITDLHRLDSLLSHIDSTIAKVQSENKSNKFIAVILKPVIKGDLDTADELIGKIEEEDKCGLQPSQILFYRPYLIEKFNGFLDKIVSK